MLKTVPGAGTDHCNRQARLVRARQLLKRFSVSDVSFIFFTDEKLFTVAAPSNTQTDRVFTCLVQCQRNRFRQTVCCVQGQLSVSRSWKVWNFEARSHGAHIRWPRSKNQRPILSWCHGSTTFVASNAPHLSLATCSSFSRIPLQRTGLEKRLSFWLATHPVSLTQRCGHLIHRI